MMWRFNAKTRAIEGGKPTRKRFLSYGMQWIDEKEILSYLLKNKII